MSNAFKLICIIFFVSDGYAAIAQNKFVEIKVIGDQRCISSNGSPNHAIGQFPNRGNPNRFKSQNVKICVGARPSITGRTDRSASSSGITITGIILRPSTDACLMLQVLKALVEIAQAAGTSKVWDPKIR